MDEEGWRTILTSKKIGDSSSDLCKAIVRMTQKLEAFVACREIPLDKNLGLRPIGTGK